MSVNILRSVGVSLVGCAVLAGCGGPSGAATGSGPPGHAMPQGQPPSHDGAGPQPAGPAASLPTASGPIIADHRAVAAFDTIDPSYIQQVRSRFRIVYWHTSHGSQIITGMEMLAAQPGSAFPPPKSLMRTEYGDLGQDGDRTWARKTTKLLDASGDTHNVAMWSWCRGVARSSVDPVGPYLEAMGELEQEFPQVRFIYMTGHADPWRPALATRNQQIRDYCQAHGKVLFDFGAIDTHDPAGTHHPKASDKCEWCASWCASHSCPSCSECAHSHCLNCLNKGKAFWWLLARLAGWEG